MKSEPLRVIQFWPEKKRRMKLGSLAKQIVKTEKSKTLTKQGNFENRERARIMRRLYHIAYGTSNLYTFPVHIDVTTNNKGISLYGARRDLDVLEAYKNIAKELRSQGFNATAVTKRKDYDDKDKWYETELTVYGVLKQDE